MITTRTVAIEAGGLQDQVVDVVTAAGEEGVSPEGLVDQFPEVAPDQVHAAAEAAWQALRTARHYPRGGLVWRWIVPDPDLGDEGDETGGGLEEQPPNVLLAAALACTARGWHVFPVEVGGKRPLARLAPRGLRDATTDERQVRLWWSPAGEPNANVGVRTGAPSGLLVLDLDTAEAHAALAQLAASHGGIPRTWRTRTPRGGQHVLFRLPEGVEARSSASRLAPGLDVRGDGGYIVAPGSRSATGGGWTWTVGHSPYDGELELAPTWLLSQIRTPATDGKRLARPATEWARIAREGAHEGSRHDTLTRLAGHVLARPGREVLTELVRVWAGVRLQPALPQDEVEQVLRDLLARELAKTRGDRHA